LEIAYRPAVEEHHPAADEDRDDGHVDVGDRREQERVLGSEEPVVVASICS
jgi:hypothetical protein